MGRTCFVLPDLIEQSFYMSQLLQWCRKDLCRYASLPALSVTKVEEDPRLVSGAMAEIYVQLSFIESSSSCHHVSAIGIPLI